MGESYHFKREQESSIWLLIAFAFQLEFCNLTRMRNPLRIHTSLRETYLLPNMHVNHKRHKKAIIWDKKQPRENIVQLQHARLILPIFTIHADVK